MAGNGGIIGPINTVTAASCVAEKKNYFYSNGLFNSTSYGQC